MEGRTYYPLNALNCCSQFGYSVWLQCKAFPFALCALSVKWALAIVYSSQVERRGWVVVRWHKLCLKGPFFSCESGLVTLAQCSVVTTDPGATPTLKLQHSKVCLSSTEKVYKNQSSVVSQSRCLAYKSQTNRMNYMPKEFHTFCLTACAIYTHLKLLLHTTTSVQLLLLHNDRYYIQLQLVLLELQWIHPEHC